MKQKLLYILSLLTFTLGWSGESFAQKTYYVLEQAKESDGASQYNSKDFELSGPGTHLYFSARKYTVITGGNIEVYVKKNGSWSSNPIMTTSSLSTSNKSFDHSIDADVTGIRFKGNLAGTRYFSNVKVTRATELTCVSSTDIGSSTLNKKITKDLDISYSNGVNPQTFNAIISSSAYTDANGGFSVESIDQTNITAETGSVKVKFGFTPKEAKTYTGTATITLGGVSKMVTLTGTGTIEKADPVFTWNVPSTAYAGRTYKEFFTTTNDEIAPLIESSDEDIAIFTGGNLFFPGETGDVTITISQSATTSFNAKVVTYNVHVEQARNRLPLTIDSEEKYNIYITGTNSNNRNGYENGIRLGGNSNVVDDLISGEKYVLIDFMGIPDKMKFTTSVGGIAPTGNGWYIEEYNENGQFIKKVWESSSKDNNESDPGIQLQPETRRLKVVFYGTYWGYVKNFTVTERRYLTVENPPSNFGPLTKGSSVEQTFIVSHCNAGTGVRVSCNDNNFEVSPTILSTGGGLMGTETVTVRYLNNMVGVHDGTITIEDVNGTNANVTFTISGTTQTTYYTRAVAEKSGNGSAYITDKSGNAGTATSTSITANSDLVTTEKAQKTVYLRAVPDEGYKFVEWKKDGVQVSTSASDTKSYSYNSESSSSPTEVTYTAVFTPKTLTINPTSTNYEAGKYAGTVTFARNLKSGYSTIALPFDATVEELVGNDYDSSTDWVAQLSVVTYNAQDGYSLYFEKKSEIVANQPYILHLGSAVDSPVFTDVSVVAAATASQNATKGVNTNKWTMYSNYTPGFVMEGYYGIAGEKIKKGTVGATLSAFRAYIEGPADPSVQVKTAYLDNDEADGILELLKGEGTGTESVYDLQGRQLPRAGRGINIIRNADGSVRKVLRK